ncbi:cysteine-rich secretory protein 3-like [Paramacrobiotus metropolitanus]|uniref:cysteine-rich secretory protein 3-like n=1 Tax=Paramacrobiotus metropolitanus TaxID=2943436 RepID=UPI002445B705|nr:cysteine-rich secretory protein 3-like [Paramacrobiotus metropolitanus]
MFPGYSIPALVLLLAGASRVSSAGNTTRSLSDVLETSLITALSTLSGVNTSNLHLLTARSTVTLHDGLQDVPLLWLALTDDPLLVRALLRANDTLQLTAPTATRLSLPVTPPTTSVAGGTTPTTSGPGGSPPTTSTVIPTPEVVPDTRHCNHTALYNASDPGSWPLVFGGVSDPEGVALSQLDTNISGVAEYILRKHNCLRTQVTPAAANMLKMVWSPEAARQAQEWAEQCQYKHNNQSDRFTPEFQCGQNIAYSTPWAFSWNSIVNMWYSEYKEYTFGKPNDLHIVGHYTAMSWATTFQLGCGYKDCGGWHYYVCNYCPSGNFGDLSEPYKAGKPCSACPDSCDGGLCTNSCPLANLYSNCDELQRKYKICSNPFQKEAADSCKATCRCPGKIYQ